MSVNSERYTGKDPLTEPELEQLASMSSMRAMTKGCLLFLLPVAPLAICSTILPTKSGAGFLEVRRPELATACAAWTRKSCQLQNFGELRWAFYTTIPSKMVVNPEK